MLSLAPVILGRRSGWSLWGAGQAGACGRKNVPMYRQWETELHVVGDRDMRSGLLSLRAFVVSFRPRYVRMCTCICVHICTSTHMPNVFSP